jgi:predicted ArsR family transcriptional regulator
LVQDTYKTTYYFMTATMTSLFALKSIQHQLPRRQNQVYEALKLHGEMTNGELAYTLHIPINQVTPRVLELRKGGMVEYARTRPCRQTGKQCMAWRAA